MWTDYTYGKQTQQQIADSLGKTREWVNRKIGAIHCNIYKNPHILPQDVVVVMDTTYFKRFGVMAFRSSNLKKNLLWYPVNHETQALYAHGIQTLINDGWNILAIVADGKPGIRNICPHIPFQLCQFHQCQIVTRYISKKPKLAASTELQDLMFLLKQTDQASFQKWLNDWYNKWAGFLAEKTIHPLDDRTSFTHSRLRKAYFSLRRNVPYLFTFEQHAISFYIPNTTNSLEGYFSHLKSKLSVHRGASQSTQLKIISSLFFL